MNTTYGPKISPPILSIVFLFSFLNAQPKKKDFYDLGKMPQEKYKEKI